MPAFDTRKDRSRPDWVKGRRRARHRSDLQDVACGLVMVIDVMIRQNRIYSLEAHFRDKRDSYCDAAAEAVYGRSTDTLVVGA
jgi:hypothetical protein